MRSIDSIRRQVRVFLAKNFYRDRYNYRKEWLRLIETLVGRSDESTLAVRAVRALAEIVDSSCGELWIADDSDGNYVGCAGFGAPVPVREITRTDAIASYLQEFHWVVDTREYQRKPEVYKRAFEGTDVKSELSIYVPIAHKERLVGIARLDRPSGMGDLSFEDHDLLKTAGQQIGVFLEQERSHKQLLETRQFEAMSRLTAFLMHDLKNMIAQQDLVVKNAARFGHRPEFFDDAISTISSSVDRMRKVVERLQQAPATNSSSRVNIAALVVEVTDECADRLPVPRCEAGDDFFVEMDRHRLKMALIHTIRNAQDATASHGQIRLCVKTSGEFVVVDVSDTGTGMDPEFIRDRLFRPFDSTKGTQGMGIGAYQIRETLREVGGSLEVESVPGRGTTMRLMLPQAGTAEPYATTFSRTASVE